MHKSAEETIQQLPRLGINRKAKVDTARKKPREAMREVIWKLQRVHHDSNMGLQLQLSNWKEIRIRSARHQERQSGGLRESLKDRRKQCLPEALVDSVAELPWESGEEGTEDEEDPSFRANHVTSVTNGESTW